HGKLDRRALPPPTGAAAPPHRAPRAPTQVRGAGAFAGVFGRTATGVDGPFFRLGGGSLLGARAVAPLHRAFRDAVPVPAPVAAPTVAALADVLAARMRAEFGVDLDSAVRRRPEEEACVTPQGLANSAIDTAVRRRPEEEACVTPQGLANSAIDTAADEPT